MPRPSLRTSCPAAARLACVAAGLLATTPRLATATVPLSDALPSGFCDGALERLAEVAESLGYTVSADESVFSAVGEAIELRCICPEDQVVIEIAEGDTTVSVQLWHARSRVELENAGEFSFPRQGVASTRQEDARWPSRVRW